MDEKEIKDLREKLHWFKETYPEDFEKLVKQTIEEEWATITNINNPAILGALQKDWNNTYFPHSLVALRDLIRQYQLLSVHQYYAKTLVFVQSSGMGKSRLADAFGQLCPMINFIFREPGTSGFPPPDKEILSFLQDEPPANIPGSQQTRSSDSLKRRAVAAWNHTLAAALLQASFETCKLAMYFFETLANSNDLISQYLGGEDALYHDDSRRACRCQACRDGTT